MRNTGFFKRLFPAFLCLTLAASVFALPGLSVSAAEAESSGNWEMTVPQVVITTEDGNAAEWEKDDIYRKATITVKEPGGEAFTQSCSLKVRGNTTALSWVKKKSYNFKFDKKRDVLGMGKAKKWVLNANTFDPTLLRNYTAFSLAKELGIPYTSEYQMVEVWLDGKFNGCYLLMEPVQQGKERVDIDVESNGGLNDFLIEYEKSRVEDDETYITADGLRFIVSEPEDPTDEQAAYVQSTLQDVITAMRSGSREKVAAKVDIESFAKFYVLNEYMKTYDFDMSSVFFYYKDGKLYAGPPWDYDMSMGNSSPDFGTNIAREAHESDGIFANNKNIYRYLCLNAWFMDDIKRVYREHYDYISNIAADGGLLDTARARYADVFARNYNEAGWRVGKWWINYQLQPKSTYEANFNFIKTWGQERSQWMSDYYEPFTAVVLLGDANGDGTVNISDATTIQRHLAELELLTDERFGAADLNGDGTLTIDDVTLLQRYVAEYKIDCFAGEMIQVELPKVSA